MNDIRYSCSIDGYQTRGLLSGSSLQSIKEDLLQSITGLVIKRQAKILNGDMDVPQEKARFEVELMQDLFQIHQTYLAFISEYKSFSKQTAEIISFAKKKTTDKIAYLREVLSDK